MPSTAADSLPTGPPQTIDCSPQPTSIGVAERFAESCPPANTLLNHVEPSIKALCKYCGDTAHALLDNIERFGEGKLAPPPPDEKMKPVLGDSSIFEDDMSDMYSEDDDYGVLDEVQEEELSRKEERLQKLAQEAGREEEWQKRLAAATAPLQIAVKRAERQIHEQKLLCDDESEYWQQKVGGLICCLDRTTTLANRLEKESHQLKTQHTDLKELLAQSIERAEQRATEMRDKEDRMIRTQLEQHCKKECEIRLLAQKVENIATHKNQLEREIKLLHTTRENERETSTKLASEVAAKQRQCILDSQECSNELRKMTQQAQELQVKITSLEERLAETKRQNKLLEAQVEKFESKKLPPAAHSLQLEPDIAGSKLGFAQWQRAAESLHQARGSPCVNEWASLMN